MRTSNTENTQDTQDNKLIKNLIKIIMMEFLIMFILMINIENLHYQWTSNRQLSLFTFQLDWVYILKSVVLSILLTRITLAFVEFLETRSVMFDPEKSLNIQATPMQVLLLFVCILPLGYVISTYTMFAESFWANIVLVTSIYIICCMLVSLKFATHFYQKMLLDYYKKHENV